jgi:hypothetical protein
MKNILTHLTGIVFVIAILIAGACKPHPSPEGSKPAEEVPTLLSSTSQDVDIFLKEILIDGRMHLEMYDTRDTLKKVVDSLETVVYPGSTVKWKNAANSEIEDIHDVRLIEADGIFSISRDSIGLKRSFKLEIPIDADPDTIKYEIVFTVKDSGTWCIDPYLRIED